MEIVPIALNSIHSAFLCGFICLSVYFWQLYSSNNKFHRVCYLWSTESAVLFDFSCSDSNFLRKKIMCCQHNHTKLFPIHSISLTYDVQHLMFHITMQNMFCMFLTFFFCSAFFSAPFCFANTYLLNVYLLLKHIAYG